MAWALIWLLLMVAAFYFLIVRPQRRRMQEMRALQASLDVGDEVVTSSGIYGTVRGLDDLSVELEISPTTVIRIARGAIAQKVVDDVDPGPGAEASDDNSPRGG